MQFLALLRVVLSEVDLLRVSDDGGAAGERPPRVVRRTPAPREIHEVSPQDVSEPDVAGVWTRVGHGLIQSVQQCQQVEAAEGES